MWEQKLNYHLTVTSLRKRNGYIQQQNKNNVFKKIGNWNWKRGKVSLQNEYVSQ